MGRQSTRSDDGVECFDLDLEEYAFRVLESKTKKPRDYLLRELDGEKRDDYLTSLSQRMKTDPAGKAAGVKDFKGLQSSLLKLGTYEVGSNTPVDEKIIQAWPARVQNSLFKKLKEMSGLDDEAEEKAKNV